MRKKPPFDYENSAQALERMTGTLSRAGARLRGIAVPWFTAQTWARLLEVADDRSNLPDTFEQFERDATRRLEELLARGQPCELVLIDVEQLVAWCRAHAHRIDGRARAAFAAAALAERDSRCGTA